MLNDIIHLDTKLVVVVVAHEDRVKIVDISASFLEVLLINDLRLNKPFLLGLGLESVSR